MTKKRATMKDVAARAGVGFKTVSRVVNDEPGVSELTAEKVRRAAAELNYRRDMTAGNLRRAAGRTDSVGLLVASVDNEFDAKLHRAVEDAAQARRVSVFSSSTDEDAERASGDARSPSWHEGSTGSCSCPRAATSPSCSTSSTWAHR